MSLFIGFLLFLVLDLHVGYFLFEFIDLVLEFTGLSFESTDFVLHIFLFLFCLEGLSHTEGDAGLVQSLVSLYGLN